MRYKPIVARAQALQDADEIVAHYLGEATAAAALGFIDALERAYEHIGRQPRTGSLRYAHELGLPGLRTWQLRRYPYLVFYVEHADHIDVWRILHGKRDIPAWLQEPS